MAWDKNPNPESTPVPSGGAPTDAEAANINTSLVDSPVFRSLGKVAYDDPDSDTTLYRVPFLNATFAICSLVLLVLTIWAIWQDYDREWKRYQHEWYDYQKGIYSDAIKAEEDRIEKELATVQVEYDRLKNDIDNSPDIPEAEYHVRIAENNALQQDKEVKNHKANMDWEKFLLEHHKKKIFDQNSGDTPEAIKQVTALDEAYRAKWVVTYEAKQRKYEELQGIATEQRAELDQRIQKFKDTEKKFNSLKSKLKLLNTNLGNVDANAKNTIRNLPLLDFFAPSAKIHKTVSEITEPLNFADVPRIDRCKSCHINIDDVDKTLDDVSMPDAKHEGLVFRSHPNLELFMSAASPHPYLEFGCTTCHYGDGHSLTFTTTSHTPQNKDQKKEWIKEYHWHKMHHNEYPMLPNQYITATCAKCHADESRIPGADKWNKGRKLVEDYGCFGCHKMRGLEDYRKVGPNLEHIASKVDGDFLYKWIRSPNKFRHQTKMPQFFDLSNSTGSIDVIGFDGKKKVHDFNIRNGVEALAIATFLEDKSTPRADVYTLPSGFTADPNNAEQVTRGKGIMKEVGCLGCHTVEKEGPEFMVNDHGPDLSTIGSKLDADYLVDWIVDPKKYDPNTRMPRLRVEQDPVNDPKDKKRKGPQVLADLVAYLLSLRNEEFDQEKTFVIDDSNRSYLKDLVYGYHSKKTTRPDAVKKTDAYFQDGGGGDKAALSYLGDKLVARYGCFGCHDGIEGYENAQPIGADLTAYGAKDAKSLDFGHWGHQEDGSYAIDKNRIAWFTAKLKNTRVFDMLPSKKVSDEKVTYEPSGQRMEKGVEDLLKMPLFNFYKNNEEVEAVVTFLAGQLPDKLPLGKIKTLKGDEKVIEDGRKLIRFLNCQGCHRVGADTNLVNLKELPQYSSDATEEEEKFNAAEEEVWLAKELVLEEIKDANGKTIIPRTVFPKHTFLSAKFPWIMPSDDPESEPESEEYSLTQILANYYELAGVAEHNQLVYVQGLNEGKVRDSINPAIDFRYLSPPLLRRQGERVQGKWFFDFLREVHPIRSNLNIRMPDYDLTIEESRTIVEMFRALSDIEGPHEVFATDEYNPASMNEGKKIFASLADNEKDIQPPPLRLGCDSCHPMDGNQPSNEDIFSWGPDLDLAAKRLRPSWMKAWLAQPTAFMPNSKMPAFWLDKDNYIFPEDRAKAWGVEPDPELTLKPDVRAKLLHMLPWMSNTTITINEGFENWDQNMDDILQYMVNSKKASE